MELLLSSLGLPVAILSVLFALSKKARLVAWSSIVHPTRDDVIVETDEGLSIVPKADFEREHPEYRAPAGVA